MAQSCHAAFEFFKDFPEESKSWMENSNYIVILNSTKLQMDVLLEKAKKKNVKFSIFREPDMKDQITSIVLEPSIISKKLCSNLPLAGKRII